jgi:transposase
VLGVDDFAFRKGQSYGAILVDQEQHRVVDLLPDREAATLANWLGDHSGIEIITRDRASYYADGIKKGAPQAARIADRWHLQKNLREVLENILNRHRSQLKKAAAVLSPHHKAVETLSDNGLPDLKPKQHQSPRIHILQAYLEPWRRLLPEEIRRKQAIPAVSPPAPHAVAWWLLKDKEKLKEGQRAFISGLQENY